MEITQSQSGEFDFFFNLIQKEKMYLQEEYSDEKGEYSGGSEKPCR